MTADDAAGSFYVRDGDRLIPTAWTRGPWSPDAQHAGPPAALLGRAVESLDGPDAAIVARMTVELLRPVPLVPLSVRAEVVRPGRRVQLCRAALTDAGGREIAVATSWRIRRASDEEEVVPERALETTPFPGPVGLAAWDAYDPWSGPSYFGAMEWRPVRGSFFELGPATVWMRARIALVEGEADSPLTRVLVAADSGNGISADLPIDRFAFVNTELSVHLLRMPAGAWVCLDSISRIEHDGVGLTETALWDVRGRVGAGAQSLVVSPR